MYWFMQAFKNYANFSGRARRREYNWFQLTTCSVLCVLVLAFLFGLLSTLSVEGLTGPVIFVTLLGFLLMGFSLLIAVPSWAVLVRRLHDIGLSGWWSLLVFVPGCGVLFLVVVGLVDGMAGPNKFGENPKRKSAAD